MLQHFQKYMPFLDVTISKKRKIMSLLDNALLMSSESNLQDDTACGPSLALAFVLKVVTDIVVVTTQTRS